MAFKIYSQRPLLLTAYRSLSELSKLNETTAASNLEHALGQLFSMTAKAYTLSSGIQDVYFQVFRDSRNLRSLQFPGFKVASIDRQWSLACQIHKADQDSPAGRPYLVLQIPTITIEDWFRLIGDGRRKQPWRVQLKISGHLGTEHSGRDGIETISEVPTGASEKSGAVQGIVDDIVKAVLHSIVGRGFADPIELLSTAKQKVLSYLKTSPLSYLVDLHGLETQAERRDTRQRFVFNTLLNADGSERLDQASSHLKSSIHTSHVNTHAPSQQADKANVPSLETKSTAPRASDVHLGSREPIQHRPWLTTNYLPV